MEAWTGMLVASLCPGFFSKYLIELGFYFIGILWLKFYVNSFIIYVELKTCRIT